MKLYTFAFLDKGVEMNLFEEGSVNDLGLVGNPEKLYLRYTANSVRVENNSIRISLDVSGTTASFKLNLPIYNQWFVQIK